MHFRISISICLVALALQSYAEELSSGPNSDDSTVSITTEPQPLYVQSGEPLTLTCRSNDEGSDDDLRWYLQGKLAQSYPGFTVEATMDDDEDVPVSTLRKSAMELNESSVYSCRPNGNYDLGYNLPVYVFSMSGETVVIREYKEDVELQCNVESKESIDYQPVSWSFKGEKIEEDEEEEKPKYTIFGKNDTLVVHKASKEDIGIYTCKMKMKNGQTFSTNISLEFKNCDSNSRLVVDEDDKAEPYVHKFDKSKNLVQGDPLVLECDVWGLPQIKITWFKQGEEEGSDIEPLDISDDRIKLSPYEGVENASLRIENLEDADRAHYTCNAENEHGSDNSTILVRVKDKLAALWPFLGICAEVTILCIIIFVYERRRNKKLEEEERQEEAGHLTNSNDHKGKDEVRHRK